MEEELVRRAARGDADAFDVPRAPPDRPALRHRVPDPSETTTTPRMPCRTRCGPPGPTCRVCATGPVRCLAVSDLLIRRLLSGGPFAPDGVRPSSPSASGHGCTSPEAISADSIIERDALERAFACPLSVRASSRRRAPPLSRARARRDRRASSAIPHGTARSRLALRASHRMREPKLTAYRCGGVDAVAESA